MPLFPRLAPHQGRVPLLNSASPWASTKADLEALWACEYTEALTTRTSTLRGYPDDPDRHQVAYFGEHASSTINSFGFSPYPLSQYLEWLRDIVAPDPARKLVIVSIGPADATELVEMLSILSKFALQLDVSLAVEYNASCPNLNGSPPPAYLPSSLERYLRIFALYASPHVKLGIKLPPYTYEAQIVAVVRTIELVARETSNQTELVSFLTSTNTLGQGLVFSEQIIDPPQCVDGHKDQVAQRQQRPRFEEPDETTTKTTVGRRATEYAVSNGYGGIAGEAIHQISLGNVRRLRSLLDSSDSVQVRTITVVGVGGVSDSSSVERFRQSGADACAVATALGREGVKVFRRIRGGDLTER